MASWRAITKWSLTALATQGVNSESEQTSDLGEEFLIGPVFGCGTRQEIFEESFGLGNGHVNSIQA